MEKYDKYLLDFSANGSISDVSVYVKQIEDMFGYKLPADYIEFMEKHNGGEGSIGESYIVLYPLSDIIENNKAYEVEKYLAILIIGSDGGGEAFAIDYRNENVKYIRVPFLFEEEAIIGLSDNIEGFLSKAYNGELFG